MAISLVKKVKGDGILMNLRWLKSCFVPRFSRPKPRRPHRTARLIQKEPKDPLELGLTLSSHCSLSSDIREGILAKPVRHEIKDQPLSCWRPRDHSRCASSDTSHLEKRFLLYNCHPTRLCIKPTPTCF